MSTRVRVCTILLCAAACSDPQPIRPVCSAIVGGRPLPFKTATLSLEGCSGVLIAPSVALTAGHCPLQDIGERHIHPGFVRGALAHDLAAYVLDVPLTDRPTASIGEPALGEAHLEGYGATEYGTVGALRVAAVFVDEIRDDGILTVPRTGDACWGDSGAPLYLDGDVVGVASFGRGASCGGGTAFVRLDKHRAWIDQILEGQEPSADVEQELHCE